MKLNKLAAAGLISLLAMGTAAAQEFDDFDFGMDDFGFGADTVTVRYSGSQADAEIVLKNDPEDVVEEAVLTAYMGNLKLEAGNWKAYTLRPCR